MGNSQNIVRDLLKLLAFMWWSKRIAGILTTRQPARPIGEVCLSLCSFVLVVASFSTGHLLARVPCEYQIHQVSRT